MRAYKIKKEVIISGFQKAIKELCDKDKMLFDIGVQERSLQFRLACYLKDFFKKLEKEKIYIDIEYNRNAAEVKTNRAGNKFYPDIILHERGSNNNNIIYCEIKKDDISDNKDSTKIKEQMNERGYKYGINLYKLQSSDIKLDMYVNQEGIISNPNSYYYDVKTKMLIEYNFLS